MVYFNPVFFIILTVACLLSQVSSFFIAPSSDVKVIMPISSESTSENDSKENNDKLIEVQSISRPISGESKGFKDYEEYFDNNPDIYLDESNKTIESEDSKIVPTSLNFPLRTKIFIDKMTPTFDGSKDKKTKFYENQDKKFKTETATSQGISKVDINTSNLF